MEIEKVLKEARESFENGVTRSLVWRKNQLRALLKLLNENEDEILRVLNEDLGKHRVEAYRDEVGFLVKSVEYHLNNLKKWVTPTKIETPYAGFPTSCELVQEPLGVVLLLSSWNFPIGLSLEPLIGAVSAGNAVVLKPSELAPTSSSFLANTIPKYLDNQAIKVVQGGPDVGEQLLEQKWDKIFFTGSAKVGRVVMNAAAKHLTPVALELGGKCPAIFDSLSSSRDQRIAAQRLVAGKWAPCYGQGCIAVDYILVEEAFAPKLIELIKETIKRIYPRPEYTARIVNKNHFRRLSNLLNEPSVKSSIVFGGSEDYENLTIEKTVLLNPPLDSEIMTQEIFGPFLPIITLKKIEDSIAFVRARPKPLVIYAFTNDEKLKKRIIEETSSGTLTFNDALVQYVVDTIPFGGVGESGFGKYHGKSSFDMFSHGKPVMKRGFLTEFMLRYPPWSEHKMELIRQLYAYRYITFFLMWVGLKK